MKERPHGSPDGVAIIGMACLFPGAADLRSYWNNILGKVNAIGDPPPGWGAERYYDPDGNPEERIYTKRGGFLGDLSRFDPVEFESSRPEHIATVVDRIMGRRDRRRRR